MAGAEVPSRHAVAERDPPTGVEHDDALTRYLEERRDQLIRPAPFRCREPRAMPFDFARNDAGDVAHHRLDLVLAFPLPSVDDRERADALVADLDRQRRVLDETDLTYRDPPAYDATRSVAGVHGAHDLLREGLRNSRPLYRIPHPRLGQSDQTDASVPAVQRGQRERHTQGPDGESQSLIEPPLCARVDGIV